MSIHSRILLGSLLCFFFTVESALIAAAQEPAPADTATEGTEATDTTPPDDATDDVAVPVDDVPPEDDIELPSKKKVEKPKDVYYGIALQTRYIAVPQAMLELFVERASSGVNQFGIGLEFSRRKDNFEMVLGIGWDGLSPSDGIWIDKGQSIPNDDPDFVEFDNFSWLAADFKVVWRQDFNDKFALRYGAGLGLGIPLGEILRSDYRCTNSDVSSCSQLAGGKNREAEDDIPPVLPVVSAMIGLQFRPVENLVINLEGGIRTTFYIGGGVGYEF